MTTRVQHTNTVRRRFSAAARTYHVKSGVQATVARHLLGMLPFDLAPARVLELGCGSGRLTALIRSTWPETWIDAIDLAPGMIDFCREQYGADARARFHVADASSHQAHNVYPLIASNCALHWLEEPSRAFAHLAELTAPGGWIAFSLMLHGTLRELHEARARVAPNKQPLGRLPSQAETLRVVEDAGFSVVQQAEETLYTSSPSCAVLLRTLHDQGVTGGRVSRGPQPLNRRELQALMRHYDEHHRQADGRVCVTYHVGYILARRAS